MFLIDDILMSPVNFTVWLAERVKEQAEKQLYDVEALKAALEELREQHDSGELSNQEFERREDRLLKTLQEARERQKAKTEGEV
ncbi:MAG: gas vesicle protein GvpG [Candidatus Omnitrophica bacterium]|nr:gas vesicle protein GvpG [Candidatus Omnitrophota bacterium]